MSMRPRRSVLYMPGSNSRALEKARTLFADSLVFDLEDAVSPENKVLARERVITAVQAGGYGQRELVVRVNGLDTPWGEEDVRALSSQPVAALCLPKIESAASIQRVADLMSTYGAPPSMAIWAMIETPRGVASAQEIAAAHPRLSALLMGTTDLAKELRVPHTPDRIGLQISLGACVLAARMANIDVLDGVYLAIDDAEGFAASCRQGRDLGFDGKTLIHPSQIDSANYVFGPSTEAIARARRIMAAWEEASTEGKALAVVDGKLVESMHVDEAKRTLAMAELIAQSGANA